MYIYVKFLLVIFFNFFSFSYYALERPNDLIVKILKEGNEDGDIAKNFDLLLVNYTGWIFNNKVKTSDYCEAKGDMFDSNVLAKFKHTKPFQFVLGEGLVIKGWDKGLQNMKEKEKRCLVIPPNLAYGNRKVGELIMPRSTLIFEVELISFIKVEDRE